MVTAVVTAGTKIAEAGEVSLLRAKEPDGGTEVIKGGAQ
jgi:hypothetical protein